MARSLIPNSTQIPDVILDYWMAELSGAEFKVLLYVARRTYGFGKDSDTISLSQISQGVTRRDGTTLDRGTGVSRMSVSRALKVLEEHGMIVRRHNMSEKGREFEENTYSINLDWEPPKKGGKSGGSGPDEPSGEEPGEAGEGVVSKCDHLVTERDEGWYHNVTRVVSKVYIQETDLQETDQETAAATGQADKPGDDAAAVALAQELVSHGVGRTAAVRYARAKPETCRRQLEYLPFAKFKTTKGAYLANAIRDEYGAPPGYEAEKARVAREQEAEGRQLARNALQQHGAAIREEKTARLGVAYRELQETRGEAFSAYSEFVEKERAKTARIAVHLSHERRVELLAAFDKPEKRLELFEAWMNSRPGASPPDPASLNHAGQHSPGP